MITGKLIMKSSKCPDHPKRQVHARGVCKSCYDKWLRKHNPGYAERQKKNVQRWAKKHADKVRAYKKDYNAKQDPLYYRIRQLRKYGMTLDDYARLLKRQRGKCAICRKPPKRGKNFNVDHCHETGRIRGLLCFRCNFGLSFFNEDPAVLQRAMDHVDDRN